MTPQTLTRAEFAATYRLSPRTVDRLRLAGRVRWFKLGGKVRILPLDEAAEANKRAK